MVQVSGKGIGLVFFALLWLAGVFQAVSLDYQVERDTSSWLERAQVASNPADMQVYLLNVQHGMEKWHATTGHAALIFKKPDNDLSLINQALKSSIERTEYMKNFNRNSTEYQVSLDDLRGQLRELDLHMTYGYWVNNNFVLWIWAWLGWIAPVIFLLSILEVEW